LRDAIIESGMEAGMQDAMDLLEEIAAFHRLIDSGTAVSRDPSREPAPWLRYAGFGSLAELRRALHVSS
jgi:hypothetical protein